MIDAILTNTVLPRDLAASTCSASAHGAALKAVRLAVEDGEFAYAFD